MTAETRARAADIVEQIRAHCVELEAAGVRPVLGWEAAAEIERLREERREAALQALTDLTQLEMHLAEIERLRAALRDCAEDLETYVRAEYGDEPHPAMKHRFDRDMAPVLAARAALERAP